jgi:Ca2+:H+ antiporter
MLKTHPEFFTPEAGASESHGKPKGSPLRPLGILLAASVGAAWMSEVLVGAAEATGAALGMSEVFLGMILLASIGGAAESGAAIAMALKNKPDLSVGVAMGSSIQIALFVTPFLVLTSILFAPEAMTMGFNRLEIYAILAATIYFLPA